MQNRFASLMAAALGLTVSQPVYADELYGGLAAHQRVTIIAKETNQQGVDLQAGYRGKPIEALSAIGKPSPYLLASINLSGDTSFAAAGLSWKFGDKFYVRPGIGIAIHDGPKLQFASDGSQTQLGSRVLFEPEFSVGARLSKKVDIEATWVHLSHAGIFSRVQNPGLDIIGVRLVLELP
ncbi:acyloxyacyl hydrolase [Parasphingorhabdus sp.]|uniref:acyloxyacyl hydrolase n=1 Tax=Parasphingorhabdus sp. TaxID=2709688 RepID=UPI003C71376B